MATVFAGWQTTRIEYSNLTSQAREFQDVLKKYFLEQRRSKLLQDKNISAKEIFFLPSEWAGKIR
jgi:hypothetical protein